MRTGIALASLLAVGGAWAQETDTKKAEPKTPPRVVRPATPTLNRATQAKSIQDSYANMCLAYVDALHRADAHQRADLAKSPPSPDRHVQLLAGMVLADPKDEVAFDALAWILRYESLDAVAKVLKAIPRGKETATLDPVATLVEHHASNPKLSVLCRTLAPSAGARRLFEKLQTGADVPAGVRAWASYRLGQELAGEINEGKLAKGDLESKVKQAEGYFNAIDADAAANEKLGTRTLATMATEAAKDLRTLAVGTKLPEVKGENLDGKSSQSIHELRGKVVVIDVWATWCGPCRAMIPHEREMVGRVNSKHKDFVLLSVSCDEKKETLTKFLEKEKMPWSHWWVGRGDEFGKTLNIRFYPTIFVLDREGVIRARNVRGDKLEQVVNRLLAEK